MQVEAAARDSTAGVLDFGALFDQEFAYVWNALRRLGVAERDLEDMTHEAFLQVYRQRDAYDTTRAVRPWLFGFAHRMAADYRRLARHRAVLVGDPAEFETTLPGARSIEDHLESREAIELVQRALELLDFDQRAVFVLHDLDGFSMKDVAESLRIPVNTGYSRLRLARARFAVVVRKMTRARGGPT